MNLSTFRSAVGRRVFTGDRETSQQVTLEELGLSHPDRHPYVPSASWLLRWVLPRSEVGPHDAFLDIGCGKGRMVLDAARRYRFKRVVGVDLSEELCAEARALMQLEGGRLRCPVDIEVADGTSYRVPDDITHLYFFNSFEGESLRRMRDNILASLDRAPRTMKMLYVMPKCHDILMESGRFRLLRSVRTTRIVSPTWVAIYEVR